MSVLWGLPDFGARLPSTDYEVYAPFEGGSYVLLPENLYVAENDDGTAPMFHLTFVRRQDSDDPATQYGVLELAIARGQHVAESLMLVRHAAADGTLIPIPFDGGWIRLVPGVGLDLPAELAQPTALGWGGLDFARWNLRVSKFAAELLKGTLTNTTIISARAEVSGVGVAPRVPVKVTFNPADLNTTLTQSGVLDANRQAAQPQLVSFLSTTSPNFTMTIDGDVSPEQLDAFGQAIAGRVARQWGSFVAAPPGQDASYLQIATADKFESAQVTWDLSQPVAVTRGWVFTLDPFATARELVATAGIDALVTETTEAPLSVGWWRVKAHALLPQQRSGILSTALTVNIPAKIPYRMQPVAETIEFIEAQDDAGQTQFRLAPAEKLQYTYTPFMLLQQNNGVRRVDGPPVPHSGEWIELLPADFPGTFYQFGADPHLLQLAKLNGTLAYQDGANAVTVPFTLESGHARASLAVPAGATGAALTVDAAPLGSGSPIRLGPAAAASQQYSLASFIQFGPQTVHINVHFTGTIGLYVVDLLPEGKTETPDNVTTLTFAPDQPTAVWQYSTDSPFQSGYRYRAHGVGASWSAMRAASAPLNVEGGGQAARPGTFDVRGVHVYLSPADGPNVFRYLAADPTPTLDAGGKPTLMLADGTDGGMLEMATRWQLDADSEALVQSDLLDKRPDLNAIALQPAPVTVSGVTLSIGDGAGAWTVVATVGSSGFPPYDAMFAVRLTADQKKQAIAALGGAARLLKVEYQIAVPPSIAQTIAGAPASLVRSADVSAWFADGSGPSHVQHSDAAFSG